MKLNFPDERPIPPPDRFILSSVIGWMELGNPVEAADELSRISPEIADRWETLAIKWDVFAKLKRWPECLTIADRLVEKWPCEVTGWIDRSFSLHELDRTRDAYDNLQAVTGRFETISTIPYNLACYACQLGDIAEALKWFQKARKVGDGQDWLKIALNDPDLEPMRDAILRLDAS
ncbi:MAG: tetratricopeptide (TPR) repeat protein [Candidatus Binatia bacterium]|jgi:tetratricopeptide (TPR) repeat protein